MAKSIAAGWEVVGMLGPESGERAASFSKLVGRYLADMTAFSGPAIVLFGHSLGGLVAFAVAQELEAGGSPPAGLVLSAVPPPASVAASVEGMRNRAPGDLRRLLAQLGGLPAGLTDEQFRRHVQPAIDAGLVALASFVVNPVKVTTPTTLLSSPLDPMVTPQHMDAWAPHLRRSSAAQVVGPHNYPVAAPGLTAAALAPALADALSESPC
jgi:surfactin synthase thioesterase subunit